MTSDLVTFLRARLDEDERTAQTCEHADGPSTLHWEAAGRRHLRFANGRDEDYMAVRCGDWDRIQVARDGVAGGPLARHIARHDPARVLAEVAAKRALVSFLDPTDAPDGEGRWVAERALLLLVLPYADHPECRPSWLPPVPDRT